MILILKSQNYEDFYHNLCLIENLSDHPYSKEALEENNFSNLIYSSLLFVTDFKNNLLSLNNGENIYNIIVQKVLKIILLLGNDPLMGVQLLRLEIPKSLLNLLDKLNGISDEESKSEKFDTLKTSETFSYADFVKKKVSSSNIASKHNICGTEDSLLEQSIEFCICSIEKISSERILTIFSEKSTENLPLERCCKLFCKNPLIICRIFEIFERSIEFFGRSKIHEQKLNDIIEKTIKTVGQLHLNIPYIANMMKKFIQIGNSSDVINIKYKLGEELDDIIDKLDEEKDFEDNISKKLKNSGQRHIMQKLYFLTEMILLYVERKKNGEILDPDDDERINKLVPALNIFIADIEDKMIKIGFLKFLKKI